ncbi:4-carboxymuconolactone decarboxylase [Mycena amicta]|nr:4-carboxymuconolactone decarboxylase [Mycena amicta]
MAARNLVSLFLAALGLFFSLQVAQARLAVDAELHRRDSYDPARIPYVFPAPGESAIADALRSRRPNNTLLALDGVLLNAPVLAQGWNDLFTVIRENTTIPGTMRELLILRTAVLNNAAYQWIQHEPVGRSEGLTTQQLRVLRFASESSLTHSEKRILGDELSAAVELADAMALTVYVPSTVYANLARYLNAEQMLEAVSTAGSYAFVSRLLMAMNVDGKMKMEVPIPE